MLASSKCFERRCRWFEGIKQPDETEEVEFYYCKAFPDGIPKKISLGEDLHKEVIKGQTGDYVFEEET